MTASADKVQYLLQASLQQTLPLLKKGILSQQQLRSIMSTREKHQNLLYSSTFKLSHFLKSIQYEYSLERLRLYRIKHQEEQNVNVLWKKQGNSDFSIIKRIIKLWDRTMHKFRYRTYLWKQYLQFCIQINSKKHFYKALTNALRFLPFQVELWNIGVRYQVQVGRNMWKARKLFHKALKLVPAGTKNIQLTKELVKFELQFVQKLQQRQKIIKGQMQQQGTQLKFITQQKPQINSQSQSQQSQLLAQHKGSQLLNLHLYDQILHIAIIQSIKKNTSSNSYFSQTQTIEQKYHKLCEQFKGFLGELAKAEENQLITEILQKTSGRLEGYRMGLGGVKLEEQGQLDQSMEVEVGQAIQQQDNGLLIEEQHKIQKQFTKQQKMSHQILQSYRLNKKFDQKTFSKCIKQLCLKPHLLQKFLQPLLNQHTQQCLSILISTSWLSLPLQSLSLILSLKQIPQSSIPYLLKRINKINSKDFIEHFELLARIIKFNQQIKNIQANNQLFRSVLVNCKQNIQFLERAKCLFSSA